MKLNGIATHWTVSSGQLRSIMNVCDDKKKSDCKDAIPDATNEKSNNLSKCSDEVPSRNKVNVDDILKHEANNDIGLSKNQE